jgi:DNA (cytosine-5)-methyltransferase 1
VKQLTVGSLFSGIGGIDLGLERAGMRVLWQSEIDPYASRVLKKHWPEVPNHGDIAQIDFRQVEPVDVLAGGFPCQDISNAGKREGIEGERSGLWSEYARAIGELRPRYVFVENVAALLARGLGRVLGDLAALGYDAEWDCIPAAAVGAPHLRDRLWLVAYAARHRRNRGSAEAGRTARRPTEGLRRSQPDATMADPGRDDGRAGRERGPAPSGARKPVTIRSFSDADPNSERRQECLPATVAERQRFDRWRATAGRRTWGAEPGMGRVADGVPRRMDRLRGLGNAVVPQIPELIGGWIVQHARTADLEAAA